jgi:anion-transporting  ArsA/GET3 family ATPase
VGKTTLATALARLAAVNGLRTLLIDVEGSGAAAALFGAEPLGYEPTELWPAEGPRAQVLGQTITPDRALAEYLEEHGLRRVLKRLVSSGAIDVIATAAPGIKDILVLGKVKQLERRGDFDLIVVDAPAAGHAIGFLASARSLLEVVRVGPVQAQAKDVLELLGDPERCSVLLVTLAEETPVNEVVEAAFGLEDRVGVKLGPILVNGLYPELPGLVADTIADPALAAAARFRLARMAQQHDQVTLLAQRLPLPQVHLPYVFAPALGPSHADELAAAIAQQVEALS